MEIFKERLSDKKFIPKWVRLSHMALYSFSAKYVKDRAVLDCACGEGRGSEIFARSGAKSIIGIDISLEAIEESKKRVNLPNVKFIQGNAKKLPFSDSKFNVYISIETIEHIQKDEDYLREAKRIIIPGGLFICSTPNRKVMNPGKEINDVPINKFHVREYSEEEFTSILNKFFNKVTIYGIVFHSKLKMRILNKLARSLPINGAARLLQLSKIYKFLFDNPKNYLIRKIMPNDYCELMVAVCIKNE